MVLPTLGLVLLSIAGTVTAKFARRSYDTHDYYVLEIDTEPGYYADLLGVEIVEQVGELEGFWLVRAEKNLKRDLGEDAVLARYRNEKPNAVKSLTPQTLRQRVKRAPPSSSDVSSRLGIHDPLFPNQWHLINPDAPEHMMNVTGLWEEGYTGLGIISSLIDDGLDYTSEDLAENFDAAHSYDYNDHEDLPTPKLAEDTHGTRCAGQIAAAKNGVCGLGIAYHSRVAAVRILSGSITDADEAAALNQGFDDVSIYSCSWGPTDDGHTMDGPDYIITKAILNGVNRGRQGKGSIYVFASGNGKGSGDECNYDGYTNSIWSVTVGSADWRGNSPWYSEACAAIMTVAYSSGNGKSIVTTDKGKNECTHSHGGTSAAAPNAAGVYALALQARPDLTWRDIQHLTVRTARPINYDPSKISSSSDTDYELTFAKRPFSYAFGYGVLDGYTFVHAALTWDLVPPQTWMKSRTVVLGDGKMTKDKVFNGGIPFGGSGEASVSSTLEVTEKMIRRARFTPNGLEHINVKVWIEHQRRGDVYVEVVSPNGIKSVLAGVSSGGGGGRKNDKANTGFPGWIFMSVKHWDEDPLGKWTITVSDPHNPDTTGKFLGWNMVFWGSSMNASTSAAEDQNKYELPPDDDNVFPPEEKDEKDEEGEWEEPSPPTTAVLASTLTTETLIGSTSRIYTKPTHFLTNTGDINEVSTSTSTSTSSAGSSSSTSSPDSTLTKIISSQKPVYALLEFLFLVGMAVSLYVFCWHRRKQRKRADYESLTAVRGEDVAMGRLPGSGSEGRGRGRDAGAGGRREMYDAFDDGSDEEEDDEAGVEQPMLPRSARRDSPSPASGGGGQSAQLRYRDEPFDSEVRAQAETEEQEYSRRHLGDDFDRDHDSGSSGSWEHA